MNMSDFVINIITFDHTCTVPSHWRSKGAPGRHFLGAGTFELLGSFVRNVLLQIQFKCLDFSQKCCQNAGNAISETQISKIFRVGACPRTPLVGHALFSSVV